MTKVKIKTTATAKMSISLNPLGRKWIVILNFVDIPMAVTKYVVKLLATAALDNT